MTRTADYTIEGFLYQINKSLLEILKSDDDAVVTVEGLIEDIEVVTPVGLTAIQCKYHSTQTKFTPSTVFKPLLQMMSHFYGNQAAKITYVLYLHLGIQDGALPPVIDKKVLNAALASTDKGLKKYVDQLAGKIDVDAFLSRFRLESGPSYESLLDDVRTAFKARGLKIEDIDSLIYPNAIHAVSSLSIQHDPLRRQISKKKLLDSLEHIKKTTISRWTVALRTKKQVLESRRAQLKVNLSKNVRLRYFVLIADQVEDFDAEVVTFFVDFLGKYHFKKAHIHTPVLAVAGSTKPALKDILSRLYQKGIDVVDGFVGEQFYEAKFFRQPMMRKEGEGVVQREFSLRVLRFEDHAPLLGQRKCDDMYVLGGESASPIDVTDVNVETFSGVTFKEFKYMLGVSNAYD